ncbi:hypothetical protein K493DRAFT_300552 [Basidiobolus meristosporus CBS 931.73]|uniref:N-acetyltransferase domain-containing protein n=1 Tax=Basidiobolus meristosporus CBS 931.73 TaxID=1314790 RepID=A0A1Y1YH54_9FUNG|nr:hypothetical protein K493DRAFT_300552 [Basidiobolus meristosporus CBS 931.73]|eukprot:ORX97203.1 hypothetical protein K493DRAFT_300552 [Basidiobolus meristosporus CBS 931.73]
MSVRAAKLGDIETLLFIAHETQKALRAAGSLQEIGIHQQNELEDYVSRGYMYLFEEEGVLGSVKLEPLPADKVQQWTLQPKRKYTFLSNFMLLPKYQNSGRGVKLMERILLLLHDEETTVVLDCWEGNSKLRHFYQEKCHFTLHGVFPENDYWIAVFKKLR